MSARTARFAMGKTFLWTKEATPCGRAIRAFEGHQHHRLAKWNELDQSIQRQAFVAIGVRRLRAGWPWSKDRPLMFWQAAVPVETYVPLAVGSGVAAIGVLVYLLRYEPPATESDLVRAWPRRRRVALKIVSGLYVALACLLLIVSLVLGGRGFVMAASLLVALAVGMSLSLWAGNRDGAG